jgi:hypothetical protein
MSGNENYSYLNAYWQANWCASMKLHFGDWSAFDFVTGRKCGGSS